MPTMAVLWSTPELAARYAPHVAELRDFFAMEHLHCGAPGDLAALAARIDSSESFREELSSMVRVILLREGGSVPRANLLEIVTVAVAGADIDKTPPEMQQTAIQQPVQQIFAFLNGVLRKPWNLAPGEERLEAEPMPDAEAMTIGGNPAVVGAEPRAASTPAFVRPESVYSRFTTLAAEMQTPASPAAAFTAPDVAAEPAPAHAAEPEPQLRITLVPDVPPIPTPGVAPEEPEPAEPLSEPFNAANVVPWPRVNVERRDESQHNLALEQFPNPAPNIFFPPPIPADTPTAAESLPHAPIEPPPATALDPEPPPPSVRPALHFRNWRRAIPPIPDSPGRVALLSGVAASLFVAALMYSAHRHADTVLHAEAQPVAPPAAKPSPKPDAAPMRENPPPVLAAAPANNLATAPIPAPAPEPTSVVRTHHASRRVRDKDYVARPFSTPIPPELAVQGAAARQASESAATAAVPASGESAPDKPEKPMDTAPATGSGAASGAARRLNVSASEMSGKLLSAPTPGYPTLARLAHVQGQVVVEAVVDPSGKVSSAHVVSGHRLLRGAAVDAVLHRRYRPTLVDGQAVEVSTTVTLDFPPPAPGTAKPAPTYADLQTH